MMARIQRLTAFVRRQHIVYQYRHAVRRSHVLYGQYSAVAQDLSAALYAEKLAENRLESIGIAIGESPKKSPLPDHDMRRLVWFEIVAIYGVFIALALWNWW